MFRVIFIVLAGPALTKAVQKSDYFLILWLVMGLLLILSPPVSRAEGSNSSASLESLKTTVKKAPNSAEARNELGAALGDQGDLDEALEQIRTAIRLKPDYGLAHYNLGITYLKKAQRERKVNEAVYFENLKSAFEAFEKALQLQADLPNTHSQLGMLYQEIGVLPSALD